MSIKSYLKQVDTYIYNPISMMLFTEISQEGHVTSLREVYERKFTKKDFEYLILNISKKDQDGLKAYKDSAVNKFNRFDIELKERQKGYPKIVDFIDYDNGVVYIVRVKEKA